MEDGKRLIEELDKLEFPILAALWFYFPESDEWRLIIATPLIDEMGPLEAYTLLQSKLEKLKSLTEITLKDITIISPKDDLIKSLRIAIHTGSGISGIRFTGNTINQVYINDAYIYRVK